MDLTVFGLEPGTSVQILVVGASTAVIVAFITVVARRWQSYWWVSMAFVVASCASLALGSYLAVRIFTSVLDSMARVGGGIASVWLGIWQATQPALAAAWLAVVLTLLATVFMLLPARKELTSLASAQHSSTVQFASLGALALAAGVTPVILFRRAMAFVLWAITPRAHGINVGDISKAIRARLLVTSTISACCFLIVVALIVLTILFARGSSPSRPFVAISVFALVASLGLSTALVINLHSFSNRYRTAALTGRMPSE